MVIEAEYDDILGIPEEQNAQEFSQNLHNGWLEFLKGKEPHSIRPAILSSWKRSLEANVDPNYFRYTLLSESELNLVLRDNKELIAVAKNIMENLLAFNPDGHINLTSSHGITLAYCGLDLTPVGSTLSESVIGTNSTARCLLEKRLVYTASGENWKIDLRKRNQHCAAAPIKRNDGSLVGVLTLTGIKGNFNTHTLGTVKAAAEAIEQQLILRQLISEQRLILETLNEGVIVVDDKGIIKTVNRYARQVLGDPYLIGRNVDRALMSEDLSLLNMPACSDKEITFASNSMQRFSCLVSLTKATDGSRVLSLRENQRIRAITRCVISAGASYTFLITTFSQPMLRVVLAWEEQPSLQKQVAQSLMQDYSVG